MLGFVRFSRAAMTGFDKFAATGAAAESPVATPEKQGRLMCYTVTNSFKQN